MAIVKGQCTNIEFCSIATTGRVLRLDEGVAFECPKCGEPLKALQSSRKSGRARMVGMAQWAALAVGVGVVAWKATSSGGLMGSSPVDPIAGVAAPAAQTAAVVDPPAKLPQAAPAPVAVVHPLTVQPAIAVVPPKPVTTLLRLSGSSVISDRLARRLASGYLAMIGDSDISLDGGAPATPPGAAAKTARIIGNQSDRREAIDIITGNSATGFVDLIRGSSDVALSVRPLDAAESAKLHGLVEEHVIAVYGAAAIVSPGNDTPSLSMSQLRAVFAGKIDDWSQLGGRPGKIQVYLQDDMQGKLDTPATLLTADSPPGTHTVLLPGEDAVSAAVTADRNAIGLVAMDHVGAARVIPVSATGAAAVKPTALTISTEDYPLTRRLYMYSSTANHNAFVDRFNTYVASASGQATVEAAGFTALTVHTAGTNISDTTPTRFRSLVAGATRVSFDFRFQPGSAELDSRGVHDVEALANFLHAQKADGHRLILAGFADSFGTPSANQVVSQKRTDTVVAALGKFGITAGKVVAFGAEVPVADNTTQAGRERNRRVEVYLAGK